VHFCIQSSLFCDIYRGITVLKETYPYSLSLNMLHKTCTFTHETSYAHYSSQGPIKSGIPKLRVNRQVHAVLHIVLVLVLDVKEFRLYWFV
jgi:hypothetical protein